MITEYQAKYAWHRHGGSVDRDNLLKMASSQLSMPEEMAFALEYYDVAYGFEEVVKEGWPDRYDNVEWGNIGDEIEKEEDEEEPNDDNKGLNDVLEELNDG